MKFRLATLFQITTVAGLLLFLATTHAGVAVLCMFLFGPATFAFLFERSSVLKCGGCSVAGVAVFAIATGVYVGALKLTLIVIGYTLALYTLGNFACWLDQRKAKREAGEQP